MRVELQDRARALENDYFRRQEVELIERLKGHLAVENARETGLICPKCQGELLEASFQDIMLDVCSGCHGVWFDAGELAHVIKNDKEGGWFGKLFD